MSLDVSPTKSGTLYCKGFFKDWNQRPVKLENHVLTIKNSMGSTTFKLSTSTVVESSNLRAFSFSLTNPNNEIMVLAAENDAVKTEWVEAINASISSFFSSDVKPGRVTIIPAPISAPSSPPPTPGGSKAPAAKARKRKPANVGSPTITVKIKKCKGLLSLSNLASCYVSVKVGLSEFSTSVNHFNDGNPSWTPGMMLNTALLLQD